MIKSPYKRVSEAHARELINIFTFALCPHPPYLLLDQSKPHKNEKEYPLNYHIKTPLNLVINGVVISINIRFVKIIDITIHMRVSAIQATCIADTHLGFRFGPMSTTHEIIDNTEGGPMERRRTMTERV